MPERDARGRFVGGGGGGSARPTQTFSPDQVLSGALARLFHKLEDELAGAYLLESALDGAEVIRAEAERLAPRGAVSKRTRRSKPLHQNIVKSAFRAERNRAQVDVGFTRDAFHGRFLELGTAKMGAKPWLRPAFDAKKDEAQAVFARRMRMRLTGR